MTKVNLLQADLAGDDLREVDLTGADLTAAILTGADLDGVNLCRVIYDEMTIWSEGWTSFLG